MQYIVGLTGLIGSGKSYVGSVFSKIGISVIDTDVIAHRISSNSGVAVDLIAKNFGEEFINESGSLNRELMRNFIFSDQQQRMKLEQIIHPIIYQEVLQAIKNSHGKYVIVTVPLLYRSLIYLNLIHRSIFVDCCIETLVKRVSNRSNLIPSEIYAILKAQIPREIQYNLSDDIIDNNGGKSAIYKQVIQLDKKYQKLFNPRL